MTESDRAAGVPATSGELVDDWAFFAFHIGWLVVALLTLFPYQIFVAETAARVHRHLLSYNFESLSSQADILLNVLLFIPFGFGLACIIQKKRCQRFPPMLLCLASSFGLSFLIEVLQAFMPVRDASWGDVATNTAGGACGAWLFGRFGIPVLGFCADTLVKITRFLSRRVLVASFLGYTGVISLVAVPLQRAAHLSNWNAAYPLILGSGGVGERCWRGRIYRVEVSSRALTDEQAERTSRESLAAVAGRDLIASYRFEDDEDRRDRSGHLSLLNWQRGVPETGGGTGVRLNGKSWLETAEPATALGQSVQHTNQLTLSVLCSAADTSQAGPIGIVSYSYDSYNSNFTLAQGDGKLVFRLRTPLSGDAGQEPELVVPGVFTTGNSRNILLIYNGSQLKLFVDGKRSSYSMEWTPGAALMKPVHRLSMYEMRGYKDLYFLFCFAPLGALLAVSTKMARSWPAGRLTCVTAGFVLPACILEGVLAGISARPISVGNIGLGILFTTASYLLLYWSLPRKLLPETPA